MDIYSKKMSGLRKYIKKIISLIYPIAYYYKYYLKRSRRKSLRVLILHDVAPGDLCILREYLIWISKFYTFITPEAFELLIKNKKKIDRNYILLTFDDGFESNYEIAVDILASMNIKAIFFIVPGLASCKNKKEAVDLISSKICPQLPLEQIPSHYDAMSWDQINDLIKMGHTIGCHSQSHARLSSLNSESDLIREICDSANIIEQMLNIKVKHFAYPFGDINSFNRKCLQVAIEKYEFIHTGIRGDNSIISSSLSIWRDSLSLKENVWFSGLFLEGFLDILYKNKRIQFLQWLHKS